MSRDRAPCGKPGFENGSSLITLDQVVMFSSISSIHGVINSIFLGGINASNVIYDRVYFSRENHELR